MALWVSLSAVVVVGLGVALVVWLVRSELRERRRRQAVARFLREYRKEPRPLPASRSQKVTVDELVARVEAEGLAVRLQWGEEDEGNYGPDDDDWPTGVLPRIEPDHNDE